MSLQLIALGALGYALINLFTMSENNRYEYLLRNQPIAPVLPTAFVGYDESSNTWVDPLIITFNAPHMPREFTEAGPYGVPRNMYRNGPSSLPIFGRNIEKI